MGEGGWWTMRGTVAGERGEPYLPAYNHTTEFASAKGCTREGEVLDEL